MLMYEKYKKIWLGIGGFLVFIVVAMTIMLCMASNLIGTINGQLTALRSGDIALAYSYTSKDFKSVTSLSDFEDFINHYSALKNNKNAIFTEKKIKNDTAVVRGTVRADDSESLPIEYILVKEEGVWKIMGIQINPADTLNEASNNTPNPSLAEDLVFKKNIYDNRDSRYTINYPSTWEYEKTGDGTIVFSGKRGTPAFFSTVNIQTVLSYKTGGDFSTVDKFMADIKHQAISQSVDVRFVDSGPIIVTEKNGAKDKGLYTVFTYKYKGKEFKQWQVVVLRNDEQVFYAWAYTSPIQQYENDLSTAKAMLASWVIY